MQKILVIDDDRELCALIAAYLTPLGYDVHAAHDGVSGAARALGEPFAAVILDLMLPGVDGFETLRRIRAHSALPVLMLTARGEETDRIVGLEMGADDYLPKTFSSRELLARLRAVTRRSSGEQKPALVPDKEPPLQFGPLRIDPATHSVELENVPVKLTALEFALLLTLAHARGRVKTREQLIAELGERLYDGLDRSIDVHIWALRRKLGDDPKAPRFLQTVRAVGYRFLGAD